MWFSLQDEEIKGLWGYGGLGPGRLHGSSPHRRFQEGGQSRGPGRRVGISECKVCPGPLEQRPQEVGRTGLGIRKERPTWGSTVQSFLGMRMADGPWGFVALS